MKVNEYQREALRTATPVDDFNVGAQLSCAALGLSEECAEFLRALDGEHPDNSAAEKEAGDVLWYLAFLARCIGNDLTDITLTDDFERVNVVPLFVRGRTAQQEGLRLLANAAEIAGRVKKAVHHRQGIPQHAAMIRTNALCAFEALAALVEFNDHHGGGWTLDSAAAVNLDKLRRRWCRPSSGRPRRRAPARPAPTPAAPPRSAESRATS